MRCSMFSRLLTVVAVFTLTALMPAEVWGAGTQTSPAQSTARPNASQEDAVRALESVPVVKPKVKAQAAQAATPPTAVGGVELAKVQGSITFYTNRADLVADGTFTKLEAQFKKLYPKVKAVKVIAFSDYAAGIRPLMERGDYGDLLLILPSVKKSEYGNYYVPLNALYGPEQLYFYERWSHQGLNYGISVGVTAEGLIYNKKVLQQAKVKVPLQSALQWLEALKKIKGQGLTPMYLNAGARWPLQQWDKYPLVLSGSTQLYERMLTQNKPFSGPTPVHRALEVMRKLVTGKLVEQDLSANCYESSQKDLLRGDAGMLYLGSWALPELLSRSAHPEDLGFMPVPGEEGAPLRGQLWHDWAYAVSCRSHNQETAKAFLKFLLEHLEGDSRGFIPTLKSRAATLPQLTEYLSYGPQLLETPEFSEHFSAVSRRAKIDFYQGGYLQALLRAKNFTAALQKLDERWAQARSGAAQPQ